MIFQLGIDLDIKDRKVQAILDLDTGLMGFTESFVSQSKDYNFIHAPIEFKEAFFKKFESICANQCYLNSKINRKTEVGRLLDTYWKEKKKGTD